jgi:enoyl-CoA hydratase/carnithine racemase
VIAVERHGDVALLLLDRPTRGNALSLELLGQLTGLLGSPGDGVRAAVIAGRGSRFSTGADLNDLTGTASDVRFDDATAALASAIAGAPYPVIAAIEGRCMGAAVDLALSCDVVVAARDATLAVPAARLGILYAPDAVARLQRRYGSGGLRRLLLLGDEVSAEDALALGLVQALAAPGGAIAHALALAERATEGIAGAVTATKRLLAALEAGTPGPEAFVETRMELLASPERRRALEERRRA